MMRVVLGDTVTTVHRSTMRINSRLGVTIAVTIFAMALVGCSTAATPSSPPGGSAPASASPTAEGPSQGSPSGPPSAPAPSATAGSLEGLPTVEGNLNAVLIAGDAVLTAGFAGPRFEPVILLFEGGAWSAAEVPGTRGQVMALAQLGGRFIAVGNELPDARNGFIWTSPDGRTWTEAASITDGALYDVVATHDVAVAVGAHLDGDMRSTAAAWTSPDGQAWTEGVVAGAEQSSMSTVTVWSAGSRPPAAARTSRRSRSGPPLTLRIGWR